jgi:hypothetical protein
MRWPSVLAVFAALAACGQGRARGPFGGLPLDGQIGQIGQIDQIAAAGASRWVFH